MTLPAWVRALDHLIITDRFVQKLLGLQLVVIVCTLFLTLFLWLHNKREEQDWRQTKLRRRKKRHS